MYYLVAYDIASSKRLGRVAKLCKSYGVRIQKSLFECHLEKDTFENLWQKLLLIVHPTEDRIVAFPICAACLKQFHQNVPIVQTKPVSHYIF